MTTHDHHGGNLDGPVRLDERDGFNAPVAGQSGDGLPADGSALQLTYHIETAVTCDRCGYSWTPRVADPLHCSRCKCRRTIRRIFKSKPEFWDNVDVGSDDECWPFNGVLDQDGYGRWYGKAAHRIAFSLEHGEPDNLVLHHCDNPPCCNPRHLYDGTQQENVRDREVRGRGASGTRNGRYVDGSWVGQSAIRRARQVCSPDVLFPSAAPSPASSDAGSLSSRPRVGAEKREARRPSKTLRASQGETTMSVPETIICQQCGKQGRPARFQSVFCRACYAVIDAATKVADPKADTATLNGGGLFARKAYTGDLR